MTTTLIYSRYYPKNEIKPHSQKPTDKISVTLPPKLQSPKEYL